MSPQDLSRMPETELSRLPGEDPTARTGTQVGSGQALDAVQRMQGQLTALGQQLAAMGRRPVPDREGQGGSAYGSAGIDKESQAAHALEQVQSQLALLSRQVADMARGQSSEPEPEAPATELSRLPGEGGGEA
jgi:hypothetical protein